MTVVLKSEGQPPLWNVGLLQGSTTTGGCCWKPLTEQMLVSNSVHNLLSSKVI